MVLPLYFGMLAVALIWAASIVWRWYKLPDFAGEVYDSNVEKELLDARIDRDEYIQAYVRAEAPRLQTYQCGVALLALLTLPLLVSIFFETSLALSDWSEDNYNIAFRGRRMTGILGDFVMFIVIMAIYVGLLAGVTVFHYSRKRPSLKSEERRLTEKAK